MLFWYPDIPQRKCRIIILAPQWHGVSIEKGVVLEGDNNHYVSGNPLYLVPEIQSCDATGSLSGSNSYVLMPIGQSIKTLDSKSDGHHSNRYADFYQFCIFKSRSGKYGEPFQRRER